MEDNDLTLKEATDALHYFIQYCKELMTEHIAMTHALRERAGWMGDYRSYLGQAKISTEAAFREMEDALAAQKGIQRALAHFASLYPVKPQSDYRG